MKSIHYSIVTAAVVALSLLGHVRAEEKPVKLEALTTSRNRSYQKVEIREVTPAGIKILHESGTATISFAELPEEVQKQLGGFDHEKAREYQAKTDKAVRDQEDAIERELQGKKEAAANADPFAGGLGSPGDAPVSPAGSVPTKKGSAPSGIVGADPFEGGFVLPDNAPGSPAESGAAEKGKVPAAAAEPGKPKPVNKGHLSARIVGYRTGVKQVEFKVRTNCRATLELRQVVPGEPDSFTIEPNTNFVREVWVYNNYGGTLLDPDGATLDAESSDRKTHINGLTRPILR